MISSPGCASCTRAAARGRARRSCSCRSGSPGLADVVAHAARLAGRPDVHRDGQAVRAVPRCAGAVRLRRRGAVRRGGRPDPARHRADGPVSHRERAAARRSCCCACRWSGRSGRDGAAAARRAALRDGAPRAGAGAGRLPAPGGRGRRRRRRLRAAAALCEGATASAFAAAESFWLFRVERLPARMHGLLTRTPGPRRLRPGDRQRRGRGRLPPPDPSRILPRQLSRRSAAPVLARRRHRGVAAAGAGGDRGHRAACARRRRARPTRRAAAPGPDLALALRAGAERPIDGADGGGAGPVESGALAAAALLRAADVGAARLPGGVARARRAGARRPTCSRGFRSARCSSWPRPTCWSRSGRGWCPRCRPRCWSSAWAPPRAPPSCFPTAAGAPFRVPPEAWFRSSCACVGALTPAIADRAGGGLRDEPIAEPVEIENRPMGPMPLWGLRRSTPEG